MKKKIIGRNKIQVQNRRQNVPGNEEEGPPSAHRVKGEADAAFWQFEWEVMSGGDKTCHFLWFSIPTQPFLSHYKVILTAEKNDNGCLAACVRRTARQQPAEGLWWVPSGDRNTSTLRNNKCSPTVCVQTPIAPHLLKTPWKLETLNNYFL